MQNDSSFSRFARKSPYALLLFLIIPGLLVLSRVLHFGLPFPVSTKMLLGNNCCLSVLLLLRFFDCLARMMCGRRYQAELPSNSSSLELEQPVDRVREKLSSHGFRFEGEPGYGEKREPGFLGTTLLYGGICLLLFVGTWDNLRQFSGTVIKGPGAALDLSQAGKYYHLITGPLSSPSGFPLLKVTKQIFPDEKYPLGASEIKLYTKEGRYLDGAFIDAQKGPYRYGGYDVYVAGLLADLALTIKTKGSETNNIFDDAVKVRPLYANRVGNFTMFGTFTTPAGEDGEVFYDPASNLFKITLSHNGKQMISTDYQFQAYREKEAGHAVISVVGMGHWTEIHVVRRRHMVLIVIGGVIAALGLLLRILFRPQRVQLEESAGGCRVRMTGKAARQVLTGS